MNTVVLFSDISRNYLLVSHHCTCLFQQVGYLSQISLFLSVGVLLLCTVLSTDPLFFSKQIISSIYVPGAVCQALIAALMSWF